MILTDLYVSNYTIDLLDQNIYQLIKNRNHEIFKRNSTST